MGGGLEGGWVCSWMTACFLVTWLAGLLADCFDFHRSFPLCLSTY